MHFSAQIFAIIILSYFHLILFQLTKDNSVRMERAIKESNSLLSKLDKKPEAHEVLDYEATKVSSCTIYAAWLVLMEVYFL